MKKGSKYTRVVTKIFLKNQTNSNLKLKKLDLTGLPLSDRLLKKLINKFSNCVLNLEDSEDSSETDSVELFSSSDQSDSDSDSESDYTGQGSESDSNSSDYNFAFGNRNLTLKSKSKSDSFKSSPKKMCLDRNSSQTLNKLQVKIDAILVNINLLEKYLRAVKNQPERLDYLSFNLVVNKLDLTIHNEESCIIDDTFDSTALVV